MHGMVSVSSPVTSVARSRRTLRPAAVWTIAVIVIIAAAADGCWPYVRPAESLFVATMALTALAVFALMTRRILVATVIAAALLLIVRTVSVTHQDITDLPLHAYDLVTLAMSPSAQVALWTSHPLWMAALFAAIALS